MIEQPRVIRETSSGYFATSLNDELFLRRRINILGEITSDSVNDYILQLLQLDYQEPKTPIWLYINSPGGSVTDGLALYDVMSALSCEIKTVCLGMAASMASIIFASGSERMMLPHSKILIHDPRIMQAGGTALELKSISDNLLQTREITAEILAKHSGKPKETIFEKTKTDSYFSAAEAIDFGLADKIIERLSVDEI